MISEDNKRYLSSVKSSDDYKLILNNDAFIRPLFVNDISDDYIDGLNDSQVNRFLVGPKNQFQTYETVKDFVLDNHNSTDSLLFGFFESNALCGTCRIHDIDEISCFIGLAIFNKRKWGKGYASKIIGAVSEFVFKELKLQVLNAGIEPSNLASRRAFEKNGFVASATKNIYIKNKVRHECCDES